MQSGYQTGMTIFQAIGWSLGALALVAILYQLVVIAAVTGFFAHPPAPLAQSEPVSLLKPLHGAEPRLADNLATFLDQHYDADVELVCGVNTPGDAAAPVVRHLAAQHPDRAIALSCGPAAPAANGKIGNLIATYPLARHDVLVLSDSDMVVGRDYLAAVVGALQQPGVGAVSCAYVGRGDAEFWSQMSAAMIGFQSTPNVILAAHFGLDRPCMGATIALRRATLEAIGGFAPLADVLADDYAIGQKVAELGLAVSIPPLLITHACEEASAGELWRHFLRWAVTIRDLNPAGHYGSVVTQTLPLALLASPMWGWPIPAAALAARLGVALAMRRAARGACAPLWLLPLADLMGFTIFCASLFARAIEWRGAGLTITKNGRIAASQSSAISPAIAKTESAS